LEVTPLGITTKFCAVIKPRNAKVLYQPRRVPPELGLSTPVLGKSHLQERHILWVDYSPPEGMGACRRNFGSLGPPQGFEIFIGFTPPLIPGPLIFGLPYQGQYRLTQSNQIRQDMTFRGAAHF